MRRLVRYVSRAVTVLSLLLCAASAALWVRSYSISDDLLWPSWGKRNRWEGVCSNGRIVAIRYGDQRSLTVAHQPRWAHFTSNAHSNDIGGRGFFIGLGFAIAFDRSGDKPRYFLDGSGNLATYGTEPYLGDGGLSLFAFALWSSTAIFALLPAAGLIAFIRRPRRVAPGHCASCGYDLRATPERCPECGKVPEKSVEISSRTKSNRSNV